MSIPGDGVLHVDEYIPDSTALGTIIAIHGLAESAATLAMPARRWASHGYRVLAVDLRGHGESPRWTTELLQEHPGDVIVQDLQRTLGPLVFDHVVAPVVIFGHSSGGAAAAALAVAHSAAISAVVLEDPFWRLPVTRHQDPYVARDAAANLRRLQTMSDGERQAEQAGREPQWGTDELAAWSLAKALADVRLVAHGDVIPSTPWPTLLENLQAAGVPVLIITGTFRTGITEAHREIARSIGAEVLVVDGAPHFIRRDQPDRFHDEIEAFLTRKLERKPEV